ncbi:hypothetical protein MACJ_000561 [Theileria orientalis]|uniref:Uncharacterized protein n=1 Tax=Theileria orientalis TaxID=68886 RepID=A0A976M5I4_THEOR|nr:hypothetical protein MACJ_000561 [Theileria orientalis]
MKINTISTYILVCLLTHGHWNLLVPVKAAGEDATSTPDADGTVASTTADGAGEDPAMVSADGSVASPAANEGSTPGEGQQSSGSTGFISKVKGFFSSSTSSGSTSDGKNEKSKEKSEPTSSADADSSLSHVTGQPSENSSSPEEANESTDPGLTSVEGLAADEADDPNVEADPANVTLDNKVPDRLPGLRPFKDDGSGNAVKINENEFLRDEYLGNLTYAFKPNVKCTLVLFDGDKVWKKGDHGLDEPKSVTYDTILKEVTVRDAKNSAYFIKDTNTGEWKHLKTMPRKKMFRAAKTGDSSGSAEGSPDVNEPSTDGAASTVPPAEAAPTSEAGDAGLANESTEADGTGSSTEADGTGSSTEADGTGASTEADGSTPAAE